MKKFIVILLFQSLGLSGICQYFLPPHVATSDGPTIGGIWKISPNDILLKMNSIGSFLDFGHPTINAIGGKKSIFIIMLDSTGKVKWYKPVSVNHSLRHKVLGASQINDKLLISIQTWQDSTWYDNIYLNVSMRNNGGAVIHVLADMSTGAYISQQELLKPGATNGDFFDILSFGTDAVSVSSCTGLYIIAQTNDTLRPGNGTSIVMYRTDKDNRILWHDAMITDHRMLRLMNADKTHDGHFIVSGYFEESLKYRNVVLTDTKVTRKNHFIFKINSNNGDVLWYFQTRRNSGDILNTSAFSLPYARVLYQFHKPDTLWGFPPIPPNNRQVLARFKSTGEPLDYSIVDYTLGFADDIEVDPSGNFYINVDKGLVVKDTLIGNNTITTQDALIVKYDRWMRPQSALTGNWTNSPPIAILDDNRGIMVAQCNGDVRFGQHTWTNPPGKYHLCIAPFYLPTTLPALPDSADTSATSPISVTEALSPDGMLHIYPNPSLGEFVVSVMPVAESGILRVVNISGIEVRKIKLKPAAVHQHIELNNLPRGTYWIHLETPSFHTGKMAVVE